MHQGQENKIHCVAFSEGASLKQQLELAALSIACMQLEVINGDLGTAQKTYRNQPSPELLILDLSQQSDPIGDLSALADVCSAHTKVLTLGTNNELGFYQQILQLGVSDYLPLPINESILIERLQRIILGESSQNNIEIKSLKARQLLISSATSGTGCSLICAQLAHILSTHIGMHLAVIDTDIQSGALDLYMGVKSQGSLLSLLEQPERIDELLLERASIKVAERLRLFKTQPDNIEAQPTFSAAQIEQLSQVLANHYSALLWELPRHLQMQEMANKLYQNADDILIVLDSSVVGLRDALRLKQYLQEKGCLEKVYWVINHHRCARYSKVTTQDLIFHAQLTPSRVLELPFDIKAAKSTDLGEKLKSGALYKALKRLAYQWINHTHKTNQPASKLRKSAKKWRGRR